MSIFSWHIRSISKEIKDVNTNHSDPRVCARLCRTLRDRASWEEAVSCVEATGNTSSSTAIILTTLLADPGFAHAKRLACSLSGDVGTRLAVVWRLGYEYRSRKADSARGDIEPLVSLCQNLPSIAADQAVAAFRLFRDCCSTSESKEQCDGLYALLFGGPLPADRVGAFRVEGYMADISWNIQMTKGLYFLLSVPPPTANPLLDDFREGPKRIELTDGEFEILHEDMLMARAIRPLIEAADSIASGGFKREFPTQVTIVTPNDLGELQKRFDEAQNAFAQAAVLYDAAWKLCPAFEITLMSLGVMRAKMGLGNEAVRILEQALTLNPANQRVQANLQAIRNAFT